MTIGGTRWPGPTFRDQYTLAEEAMMEAGQAQSEDIYESDTIEELALVGEFDAKVWVREFMQAMARTPELATDEETMGSWFAVAIMAGYDRGRAKAEPLREALREVAEIAIDDPKPYSSAKLIPRGVWDLAVALSEER